MVKRCLKLFDYLIKKIKQRKKKRKTDFFFEGLTGLLREFLVFMQNRINIKSERFFLTFKHLEKTIYKYGEYNSKIYVAIDAQKLSKVINENIKELKIPKNPNLFLKTFYAHVLGLSAYAILNIEGLPPEQAKQGALSLVNQFWNYRFKQPKYIS